MAVRARDAQVPVPAVLRALQLQAHGRREALADPHPLGSRLLGRWRPLRHHRGLLVIVGSHVLPEVSQIKPVESIVLDSSDCFESLELVESYLID